jgi:hypothetical protein
MWVELVVEQVLQLLVNPLLKAGDQAIGQGWPSSYWSRLAVKISVKAGGRAVGQGWRSNYRSRLAVELSDKAGGQNIGQGWRSSYRSRLAAKSLLKASDDDATRSRGRASLQQDPAPTRPHCQRCTRTELAPRCRISSHARQRATSAGTSPQILEPNHTHQTQFAAI